MDFVEWLLIGLIIGAVIVTVIFTFAVAKDTIKEDCHYPPRDWEIVGNTEEKCKEIERVKEEREKGLDQWGIDPNVYE